MNDPKKALVTLISLEEETGRNRHQEKITILHIGDQGNH